MSNYEEEIISQNVVNLISEEKLQEMEASGTVPPNQEFLTPDDIEDIPVDCIRTEVVYDNRSANKHWDYEDGIPSGTTVTGKDFSKYVKLIVHTYQASTIGGVRGSCEVDLTQPSLQWDGSEQTYYAGSNVYYCKYIDDGSDDYVQSRTCMALVDSTKTSITVYSTKTGKYHQQANDGKIFMIEGVLKTPAMIYTGAELHEGNGISIKDGVISKQENYSTSEHFTGKYWIDGKPIYRQIIQKTFDFNSVGQYWTPLNQIVDVDTVVDLRYVLNNSGVRQSYNSALTAIGLDFSISQIGIYCNVAWQSVPMVITIEYTKKNKIVDI